MKHGHSPGMRVYIFLSSVNYCLKDNGFCDWPAVEDRRLSWSRTLLVKSHPQGQSNALIKAARVFLQQEMIIISPLGGAWP